ncbi:MAG: MotA/TolQ/ExbB proton channel family protein [Verrucomicrobiota bacterium]
MIDSTREIQPLLAAGIGESADALWNFLLVGGFFMLLIGLASIVSVTVIIFKFITLSRARTLPPVVEEQLQHCEEWAAENRFHELAPWLKQHPSTASSIGVFALQSVFTDREEARSAVQSHAREEMVKLERGVAVLEVIITIAPLMGLLGTVAGLVGVFGNLGEASSSNDYSLIARGISEALGTTIAGLVVAVPAVIAHSYFSKQLEALAVRMEVLVGHLINVRYRVGGRTQAKREKIATADLLDFDADDPGTGLLNPAN